MSDASSYSRHAQMNWLARSLLSLLVALLCTDPSQAGDFEDGAAAATRKDYATALEKWRSAAQQGDARAQHKLGVMYELGRGVEKDHKEAVRWYKLAAAQGDANAQINLGSMYADGTGVARNDQEAVRWYKLSAAQGDSYGQAKLGMMYELGRGVPQDYKEAVHWYRLAAAQGLAIAQTKLGFIYFLGEGVVQDYKEAVRWYKLAAAQGEANAREMLMIAEGEATETASTAGNSYQFQPEIKPSDVETERRKRQDYEDGFEAYIRKDYETALTKLRSAAQQGYAKAQFHLGGMFEFGKGVGENGKEALRWYQLAAQQGLVHAQRDLGLKYELGHSVAKDLKEAMRWYQLAAAQGDALAQARLGEFYKRGEVVAQDYKEAVRWYQLAAAQGITSAQYNLGVMYEKGEGAAQDYKEALRWYRLAAARGNADAKKALEIAERKGSEPPNAAANSSPTETRIRPSDVEEERKKRQEIEELLAQERKAKTAELEAATRKQQELEARLRESAERERLASVARVQAAQIAPTAQAQRPQIAARKERRLALVIGNSSYKDSPLDNPANDATDIANQLKSFGFQTTLLRDATLSQMRDATRKFADQLPSSDVALIYFAGHGIELKGRNYMIPINADVKFEYELADQAYDAGQWLEMLEMIKSSNSERVNIVILDACRNNGLMAARSLSRGLGKMDAPSGTFLAYSTSPGKVALDGARGERNSPFTKHLIRAMQQENRPIEEVFKEVRRNVGRETNGSQVPWERTSLTGFFTFKQSQ
jgi:TPR repeat protein